jgi:hypothetical protein
MNDGSQYNIGRLWTRARKCKVCGLRRKSACNPERICAKCYRETIISDFLG